MHEVHLLFDYSHPRSQQKRAATLTPDFSLTTLHNVCRAVVPLEELVKAEKISVVRGEELLYVYKNRHTVIGDPAMPAKPAPALDSESADFLRGRIRDLERENSELRRKVGRNFRMDQQRLVYKIIKSLEQGNEHNGASLVRRAFLKERRPRIGDVKEN